MDKHTTRWRRQPVQAYRTPSSAMLDLRTPPGEPGRLADGEWVVIGTTVDEPEDRFVLASFGKRSQAVRAVERYRRLGIEAVLTIERSTCRR